MRSDVDLRRQFHARLRTSARDTTLVAGVIGLVAFPAWSAFDAVLVPERAATFISLRAVFTALLLGTWLLLRWRRTGLRWPEPLALAFVTLIEVPIAWMLPRAGDHLDAYLLGFSLALYATGFLIVWRWHLTVVFLAITLALTVGNLLVADPKLPAADVATIGFYLATAFALAAAAQLLRYRQGWEQFRTQQALVHEQARNRMLVVELGRLSNEDALTGLPNRRIWDERLPHEFARARRSGSPLSVIMCDFDRFKEVNDVHGHAAGDEVLRFGARVLDGRLRSTDLVARLGGDEFAIACPETPHESAVTLAEHLAASARTATWPDGIAMTFSLGVATIAAGDADAEALVRRADVALYRAKRQRDAVASAADDAAQAHRPVRPLAG